MAKKSENTKADVTFDTRIITLRSVYDKSGLSVFTPPCPDKNGNFPPCVKRVDSNGDMIMSEKEKGEWSEGKAAFFPVTHMFEIKSGKTYNLDDMWDAAEWEAIKNCPYIAKSRDERDANGNLVIDGPISTPQKPTRNGVAVLYIENPVQEVAAKVSKAQLRHKAESFIFDDPKGVDGRLNMARLLGKNMRNQPDVDVLDFLLRIARDEPQKIINLYTGDEVHTRLLFIDAKEKHVVYIKNKLYMYGDNIVLGATDDAVIAWMREPKNRKVVDLISRDTYPDYYPDAE